MHALWRPGSGLAVWRTGETSGPLGEMLPARRFRRKVSILGHDGLREFVTATTLGTSSTVALLDATRSVRVSDEFVWYRHLLDGVRAFVSAGSVAPAVATIAGEPMMRWQLIPSSSLRGWLTMTLGAAPEFVMANGGTDSVDDLLSELVDHECRARLAEDTDGSRDLPVIRALLPDPTDPMPIDPASRGSAASAWIEWSGSSGLDESTIVFRLHEPTDDEDDGPPPPTDETLWRLAVCRRGPDGHIAEVAPHRLDPSDLDSVTSDLATAVGVFDELRQALPDRSSLDFWLRTEQVERLLDHGAGALTDAGLPVLLPRTIADVRPTLGVRALPVVGSPGRSSVLGLSTVAEFEWRLALGDDPDARTLTDADIDELSRQKGDLVRVRGVWMRAEGAALSRAAMFIAAQRSAASRPTEMGELFDLLASDSEDLGAPVTRVQGLSWLDDIAATGTIAPAALSPITLTGTTLRPYQQRGVEWLVRLAEHGIGGVLADDMGLGKTIQVIGLITHENRTHGEDLGPTLIVCPMSVVGNWAREIARFAPSVKVAVHHGPDRLTDDRFTALAADHNVVITTFALATRDRAVLGDVHWRRVVVDEAQHLKNVNTAASRAVRSLHAAHRVALTGTPVENRLEDLRAVIDLVNPGLLGSPKTFRARFAEPIERERDPQAVARLSRMTRPFILRREKTDPSIISDLPDKTEITVRANLTVEQATLYRAVLDELMEALRDKQQRAVRRRTVLAALTRLKQICNHPAHYLADGSPMTRRSGHRSGKVELLGDIVTTLVSEGDRALMFTQFAAFGEMLSGWLSTELGTSIPLLHGGVTRSDRESMVADFTRDDGPPVMLATLKAGGTGLNLTAANHVIHVDRWWNPAVEDQATDRAYRIGQRRDVHVRRFVCVGTLEERIDDMIAAKRELSRLTVAAGESWMSDLGDDALYDLFALREEAISE